MKTKRAETDGSHDASQSPSAKKTKVAVQDKGHRDAGGHRVAKSIDDLVKLAVSKEELRGGKKKKRDKLKNKLKMRKLLETKSCDSNTSGTSSNPATNKSTSKVPQSEKSSTQSNMTGTEKVQILENNKQAKVKKFGSWFPTAFTVKGDSAKLDADEISIALFYQYVEPAWSESRKQQVASPCFFYQSLLADQYTSSTSCSNSSSTKAPSWDWVGGRGSHARELTALYPARRCHRRPHARPQYACPARAAAATRPWVVCLSKITFIVETNRVNPRGAGRHKHRRAGLFRAEERVIGMGERGG
jgi:hypothetical protein